MNKDVKKQRKLLVQKLKQRGVSVVNPLFEHGIKAEMIHGGVAWANKISHRSASTRIKGNKRKGYNAPTVCVQTAKVIIKHVPVTLSIAELSKATGMFKGKGGTKHDDRTNKVADDYAKTHKVEAKKTQNNLQYYYTKVGKGWTKGGQGRKPKKPIDEQPS
jgi:hypothetical protein